MLLFTYSISNKIITVEEKNKIRIAQKEEEYSKETNSRVHS